jgi:GNAT superfamily N-acetyltransferase
MHKLQACATDRVRPLFETMRYNLAAQAILEGSVPAQIYVDNAERPRVALTWHGGRGFLAGSPGNRAFNNHLLDFVGGLESTSDVLVLYYEPAGAWEETLDSLLADLDPIRPGREYYELQLLTGREYAALPALPEQFSLRYVDEELLADRTLGNRDELIEELCSERESVPDFLEKSFGYCLLHHNDVAGWCLSEYNTGDCCEVGIATFEPYRRQGLATATGSALLNQAASQGITQVGWHCYASNVASAATARSLGFRRRVEYPVRLAYFDATINHAVHGTVAFKQGEYGRALTRCREAMEQGNPPVWVYWNAACASALLGLRAAALDYLDQAVDRGFNDLERLLASEHLTSLHGTEGWQAVTSRLQA